jgi:hypothetical protein
MGMTSPSWASLSKSQPSRSTPFSPGRSQALEALDDAGPDADRGAGFVFQMARRRHVRGVQTGFQDPGRTHVTGADLGDDRVDEARVGGLGHGIEIQDRIDDRAKQRGRIYDKIGHRPRGGVMVSDNFRLHANA